MEKERTLLIVGRVGSVKAAQGPFSICRSSRDPTRIARRLCFIVPLAIVEVLRREIEQPDASISIQKKYGSSGST